MAKVLFRNGDDDLQFFLHWQKTTQST